MQRNLDSTRARSKTEGQNPAEAHEQDSLAEARIGKGLHRLVPRHGISILNLVYAVLSLAVHGGCAQSTHKCTTSTLGVHQRIQYLTIVPAWLASTPRILRTSWSS